MQLTLHQPQTHYFIRSYHSHYITVVDRDLQRSFILSGERLIEEWPVSSVSDLDTVTVKSILDLEPEVVLLGTGSSIVFPKASILAEFLSRKIGIEIMDNAAASRTFNVLSGEGRKVVAAFILS